MKGKKIKGKANCMLEFEIPYWKDKKLIITLHKIIGEKFYAYRLGVWKYHRFGEEYGGHKDEWGTRWWKFYDLWKGRL